MSFFTTGRGLAAAMLSVGFWPAAAQTRAAGNASVPATNEQTYDTQKHLTVAVVKFPEAREAFAGFIRRRAARVQKQEETPNQLSAEFALPTRELPHLDSLAAALGSVLESNLNSHDLTPRQQELAADEKREEAQVATLQQELSAAKPNQDNISDLRRQVETRTDRLTRIRQEQAALTGHAGQAYVTLRLYDEVSFPMGNHRVSFVNMPGVEYSYLHLDNPVAGLTSQNYQGYSVKYLVTRGKSYLNLGVYKPVGTNVPEEGFANELFVINFGQDFYPRNFGRGRRRFLNLYSSYQIGGFILGRNNEEASRFIPNLNLGLGVELLKTRHILLDTKASYFVLLDSHSRELRGILGQASFNFVF